jgi:hypothetical protein
VCRAVVSVSNGREEKSSRSRRERVRVATEKISAPATGVHERAKNLRAGKPSAYPTLNFAVRPESAPTPTYIGREP